MSFKPIYLEPSEEITSVIDKIKSAEGSGVAIVPAKNSTLFQSLVNLKLLAKEAKRLNKNVAVITSDKVGQRLAGQVGVAAYASIGALPAPSPAKAVAEVTDPKPVESETINGVTVKQYNPDLPNSQSAEEVVDQSPEPTQIKDGPAPAGNLEPVEVKSEAPVVKPSSPEPVDLPPIVNRSGGFSESREFKIPWKALAIGGVVTLLLMGIASIFIPRATVVIALPSSPISEEVTVVASVSDSSDAISGTKITVKKSKSSDVTATGRKDIGTRATGNITITNRYTDNNNTGRDQTFPAGTRVTDTNSNKVFQLTSSVTVGRVTYNPSNGQPIYQSQSVGVIAQEPGEEYNIGPSTFNVAGALSNTPASSSSAFTGGLKREVTVLSQSDVDEAIIKLRSQMREEALEEIVSKANGKKVVEDGIWEDVDKEESSEAVGAEVSSARVEASIEYGIIVFDEDEALKLFTEALEAQISRDEEIVFPEGTGPEFRAKEVDESRDNFTFEIFGDGYKVPKIDRKRIASEINNMASSSAVQLLIERYKAGQVDISIQPSWWLDRLPLAAWAIKVEYGFDTGLEDSDNEQEQEEEELEDDN